ncbi:endolysin [Staphylococcus phage CF5]|uniref:Endolysin n=1 Tax=Staphylococcus phage CF5 TaxID=3113739 RepID=A0AAX4J7M8_9CAUD|nr:endolysin [Staphylococcus phage CF5]
MKLHVGKDPVTQSITKADMEKMQDYFIKQIKMYYNGKTPTPTVVNKKTKTKPTSKKSSTNGWNINSYGTYYKAENGTFKCNVRQGIITRYTAPFVSCQQAGVLYYGQSVNYDTVCKQDGYVWISWTTYDGSDVWMPVRTWDKNTDKVGKLWGTIY